MDSSANTPPIAGPASTSVGGITVLTEIQDIEPVPGPSMTEGPLTEFASTMSVEPSNVSGLTRNEETEPVPGPSELQPTQAESDSRPIHRSPGSVTDKYDMGRELGRGRFGIVKIGVRKSDQQKVAIKFIKSKKPKDDPGDRRGPPKEVMLLNMLMAPPSTYTVRLFEWFQEETHFHLVMEYPEPCEPIGRFLSRCGHLEDSVGKSLMVQVVRCAQECINHGVSHNDMHTSNVLINTALMQIKLIDFGQGLQIREPEVHPHQTYTTCLRHALQKTVEFVGKLLEYIAIRVCIPEELKKCIAACQSEKQPSLEHILSTEWLRSVSDI
ncbi:serine/threonine-protein kinase pim-2-like isoform X1 [Danio rerio]|uniref:non-specific serine/threonine protein kinase n=1 Tax=Danio rerio TaxID=7955 RepID=A0AB32TW19_DANRE